MRPRRDSRLLPSMFSTSQRSPSQGQSQTHPPLTRKRHRSTQATQSDGDDDYDAEEATDRTPLITGAAQHKSPTSDRGYGLYRQRSNNSNTSSTSNHNRRRGQTLGSSFPKYGEEGHDVNNPPSHPPSPSLDAHPDDVMVANGDFLTRSPSQRRMQHARDALIDIDGDGLDAEVNSAPPSPRLQPGGNQRNRHMGHGDVCFPGEEMSEMADEDEDLSRTTTAASRGHRRARRQREWPQLWAFDEWSREEKEYRDGERRAKKINEPMLVQGRLRPTKPAWHRNEEDAPFRYTYFNEEFESTIHAQTISELVQPGASFRELFIPDPPELSDSSESEEEDEETLEMSEQVGRKENAAGLLSPRSPFGQTHENKAARFESTLSDGVKNGASGSREHSGKSSGQATPQMHAPKAKKYGPRPTFWLDVQSPTDQEMRVLCKAFGIHALTSEDIMMQEAREKVELFRNYYFINYRTFEQDPNSEDYLEPVNMYVCVFRYGIVTFHFSQIPHPANVRRRIRQLTDYLVLSADWVSYAIIDDITDVYQPLISNIESEVDEIDDLILKALSETNELKDASSNNLLVGDNKSAVSEASSISGIDMLRRIGECRKKVMSLYRLLGQKADVIKGFAKRCNEQWDVAPKSEIGLYLGDIQDHIVTMSSNLHHYETLLGRAHSNYLAQVSIRMNERQELTADVLGKLTVCFLFFTSLFCLGYEDERLMFYDRYSVQLSYL